MWQLSYRAELAASGDVGAGHGGGAGGSSSPRPVDGGGFLYHKMETQAEFDMHELWVAKRKNEIARKKNEGPRRACCPHVWSGSSLTVPCDPADVKAALDEWQQHRNRIEAEIQRKIEAKRAPAPCVVVWRVACTGHHARALTHTGLCDYAMPRLQTPHSEAAIHTASVHPHPSEQLA